MPNWCTNYVTFKHEDLKELNNIVRAWNSGQLMGTFMPCPPELKNTVAGCAGPAGSPEQITLEAQEQQNIQLYGARNWYEWQVGHWGTKWDVGREKDAPRRQALRPTATRVNLRFDSAWSPPVEFFEYMRQSRGFNVKAYFFEPGLNFCGIYDNGAIQEYEIPDTVAAVESTLPRDLVTMFNIDEMVNEDEED
jgi:hypothetical protein